MQQTIQASWFQMLTMAAFALHIAGGSVGLVSGTVAAFAKKGGRLHRRAGNVFVVSMVVMAVFGAYLAVVRPNQLVNLFISSFALYLIATGWLTVWRRPGAIGVAEKIGMVVSLCLAAPFVILSFQLAAGLPPLVNSAVPYKGPVLIAIFAFTTVLVITSASDVKLVWVGGIRGVPRISRHLWRLCFGLTLAAGSAFTNGFARFLPGPYHVPTAFFLPQFLPVILLIFWMIRLRVSGWYRREAVRFSPQQG